MICAVALVDLSLSPGMRMRASVAAHRLQLLLLLLLLLLLPLWSSSSSLLLLSSSSWS